MSVKAQRTPKSPATVAIQGQEAHVDWMAFANKISNLESVLMVRPAQASNALLPLCFV